MHYHCREPPSPAPIQENIVIFFITRWYKCWDRCSSTLVLMTDLAFERPNGNPDEEGDEDDYFRYSFSFRLTTKQIYIPKRTFFMSEA